MSELCAAVAFAQVERMDELIKPRLEMAFAFNDIARNFPDIITPQKNYPGAENTYWTWVCKLNKNIDWEFFKSLFVKNGGDPFYGAWSLTFNEPFVKELRCFGREDFLTSFGKENWKEPNCPSAEITQPRLCQFQTNILDPGHLDRQANALDNTLREING